MSLSWLPPKPELRNGVIVKYTICIRVYSHNPGPCLREIMLERRTEYRYTVVDLKPYTKYVVQISAGTVIGMGPHVSLENETLQAGKKHRIRLCREFINTHKLLQACK